MNTQVQKIKDEIERRIRETDLKDVDEYRSLLTFINSLPEEPEQSVSLNKAAQEYSFMIPTQCEADSLWKRETEQHFKHGAIWYKKQIMKDAIPAKVVNDEMSGCVVDCDNGCLVLPQHAYKMTDKLNIIIIKEDNQ